MASVPPLFGTPVDPRSTYQPRLPAPRRQEFEGPAARERIRTPSAPSRRPQPSFSGFRELEVRVDAQRTMWCDMNPSETPSFTRAMLDELNDLHARMNRAWAEPSVDDTSSALFYVLGSAVPGIFNLGGDLAFFLKHIQSGDREGLRDYAYSCVRAIYTNAYGFEAPIVSIGIIEGDALGGGFEAALSCNVLIAERGTQMGCPESLFGAFPGMGAYSFLSRKLDPAAATKFILDGAVHTAEDLYDRGLIDILADKGQARAAARDFIAQNTRRQPLMYTLNKVRGRVSRLTLSELREVTDIWVDAMMALDRKSLRRMELLVAAQHRRVDRLHVR